MAMLPSGQFVGTLLKRIIQFHYDPPDLRGPLDCSDTHARTVAVCLSVGSGPTGGGGLPAQMLAGYEDEEEAPGEARVARTGSVGPAFWKDHTAY